MIILNFFKSQMNFNIGFNYCINQGKKSIDVEKLLTWRGWVRQSQGPCFGWRTSGDLTSAMVGKCPEWNPWSIGSELICKLMLTAGPEPLELLVQLLFSLLLQLLAVARWARPRGRLKGLGGCWWRAAKKIVKIIHSTQKETTTSDILIITNYLRTIHTITYV